MSGHSKWSQIKHKKGIKDQQKGKIFSKMARMITLAVKESGGIGDPDKNIKLRLAMEMAKTYNLPKENISRAIEKGLGQEASHLKEVSFEGFGPGGSALIILATTDNPNRTLAEVRGVLEKNGGKLGATHSTAYLFDRCGIIVLEKSTVTEGQVLHLAAKAEAKDIEADESSFSLTIPFEKLGSVKDLLGDLKASKVDIDYRPLSTTPITRKQDEDNLAKLIEALEELDDVHRVYTNASTSET